MPSIKSIIMSWLKRLEKFTHVDMMYATKSSFWLGIGSASSSFILFLVSVAYANLLSKETYGLYRYILSITALFASLTLSGMNTSVTQAVARGFEGTFTRSIPLQIRWSIVYVIANISAGVWYLLHDNFQIGWALIILSFINPLSLAYNTYIAFLNGKKDFQALSKYNVISTVFVSAITFLTLLITHRILVLVAVNAIANALINVFIHLSIVQYHHPNHEVDPQAFNFAKHLSFLNIFGAISAQIDNIIIYHFLGASELAIFTFATVLPDRLRGFTKILQTIAIPKFAQKSHEQLMEGFAGKLIKLLFLLTFLAGAYALCAPFFYSIFFPKYGESVPLTQLYSLTLIASASTIPIAAMLAKRQKKNLYTFSISGSLFQMVSAITLIPLYGLKGAVFAKLASFLYNFTASTLLLYKNKT